MNKLDWKNIKLLVLDFDGVLTDNKVIVSETGEESVICDRRDGFGIELIRNKTNVEIIVLSKETNKVTSQRCKKLKIQCRQSLENKYEAFLYEIKKRNLSLNEVCFVGNDLNDVKCVQEAGIGVAVQDSFPDVKKVAKFITQKKGGDAAVREVTDILVKEHEN